MIIESLNDLENLLTYYNSNEKNEFSMASLPQSYFELKLLKIMNNKFESTLVPSFKYFISTLLI